MTRLPLFLVSLLLALPSFSIDIDTSAFESDPHFSLSQDPEGLAIEWSADAGKGRLEIDFRPQTPLIRAIGLRGKTVMSGLDPQYLLWVGERDLEKRSGWSIFFDRVPTKHYSVEKAVLRPHAARVTRSGNRATLEIDGLASPHFRGSLTFTFYKGSPFIHMEARLSTERPATAFLYHCGLSASNADSLSLHYLSPDGAARVQPVAPEPARTLQTKFRSVAVASPAGSIGIMPAPHQFLYPLDFVENYGYNWAGFEYLDFIPGFSWGIRQPPIGDQRYVPWVNGPEGTIQKLGAFLVISDQPGFESLETIQSYTRKDAFKPLPGYKTFTSHYHVEHALDYIEKQQAQNTDGIPQGLESPQFVDIFKEMGVDIVHLAEFHKGATRTLPTQQRLAQLKVMHAECARLSSKDFLLLPGEEPNVHFGGHWISFFPKPVNWVLIRPDQEPFEQEIEGYGTVYHVGSSEDVFRLFQKEKGLYWTAHGRIKGSTGYPDLYKDQAFFKSDHFLGAAWKAMPADYSRSDLGWRILDLLDDMNNWGEPKQIVGEVDVFQIFDGYELYGAMNINYLKLDALPKYEDGWQPVLDALRHGAFFVTTGEILIPECVIGGKESGETLKLGSHAKPTEIVAQIEWTFPLAHAEIVSGDGNRVYRERIDLSDTEEFGTRTLRIQSNLAGRKWVRLEIWDIAANGAFTQPVWIE